MPFGRNPLCHLDEDRHAKRNANGDLAGPGGGPDDVEVAWMHQVGAHGAFRHGMDGHASGRGEGDSRGLAIEGRKNHGALLDLSEKRSPRLGGDRDEE